MSHDITECIAQCIGAGCRVFAPPDLLATGAHPIPKKRKPPALKVFVVIGVWHYEGSNVIGVYSTQRRAEKAKDRCTGTPGIDRCTHDDHEIYNFTVDA